MGKLLNWLLSKTPIVKQLNGNKKYIGVIMVAWSGVIYVVAQLISQFPDITVLSSIHGPLVHGFESASQVLAYLGLTFAGVGSAHDAVKEKLKS